MSGFAFNKQAFNTGLEGGQQTKGDILKLKLADQQKKAYDQYQATGINQAIIAASKQLDPESQDSLSKTIEALGNNSPEGSMTILKGIQDKIQMQATLANQQKIISSFQNQGNAGPQTSNGTPQVSGSLDSGGDNSVGIPTLHIAGMDIVNPSVQNRIMAGQKATENAAALKLKAQESFQQAVPVISSAIKSLDDVQTASQALPNFDASPLGQAGAKTSMALKAYSQDPATTEYNATLGRVGPSLTRLNIGNSNRINVQELAATQKALGSITTPLATKLKLIDNFRDSVVAPLKAEAKAAGYTPDMLKAKYPDVYNALYMRKVADSKGNIGYVPNEKFESAIASKKFKRA